MEEVSGTLERVARLSYGRLVARLAARTGRVDAAVDALGDALLRALETWPRTGLPRHPEAWLLVTARNRIIDASRRARTATEARGHLGLLAGQGAEERAEAGEAATQDPILNLMFVCAHPAIEPSMRTPLMLQLVLGLDARRMAGAFLVSPAALGRRLTRARAKIEAARIGFALPGPEELAGRLDHVLDAVYAAYTVGAEGAGAGDAKCSMLAREAVWLAGLLARAMPEAAEAQGLLGLMLHGEARRPARLDGAGRFVPLEAQDPARWDAAMMEEADLALRRASARLTLGRYQIEAAIQAAHGARRHGRPTDWAAIAALYRGLVAVHPSIGARTGLAVALGETGAPEAGLAVLEEIDPARRLGYQPWWVARAHLSAAAGRDEDALAALGQAIALTTEAAVRDHLLDRRRRLAAPAPG